MSDLDGLKLLRRIEEGVAGKYGEAFFRQIVCELAIALGAHASFAARLNPDRSASMLAFWVGNRFETCTTYALDGTPCQFVYEGRITSYARDIGDIFPVDREWFASMGVNSYLGIPIKGETSKVMGHMTVMDRRERDWREADVDVLRLFSLRTAVELERDASHRQLQASNRALADANSRLIDEVGRRVQVERELAAAKIVAESASHAKSVFISQMSHELRTPLNGIMGYAQLMNRSTENLSLQQRDGLRVISSSGEHLLALVNDLLDLAKIEAGKLELSLAEIDVGDVAEQVKELVYERAQQAGVELEVINDVPARPLLGDARALRQVLLNLVVNAIKFTPARGRAWLRLKTESEDEQELRFRFEVEDTGIGIPPAEINRIFEPFHRVAEPRSQAEGTGLGLTITRRLVEAMGGSLSAHSTVGVGSMFEFSAVFRKAEVQSAPKPQQQVIVGYRGARRRVLLVDDDPVGRNLVRALLKDLGFVVATAEDGMQALRAVATAAPHLLVTDLIMPKLDGVDLLQTLRRAPAHHTMKIMALSASTSLLEHRADQMSGFDAVLKKPVRFDEFLEILKSLLDLEWEHEATLPDVAATETAAITAETEDAVKALLLDLARQGDVSAMVELLLQHAVRSPALAQLHAELNPHINNYDTVAIRRLLTDWNPPRLH